MTKELKVYVMAVGIKNRCRKIDRHMIKLGNHPLTTDRDALRNTAKREVKSQLKTVNSATIHFDIVEIADGFETWIMFDKAHVKEVLSLT